MEAKVRNYAKQCDVLREELALNEKFVDQSKSIMELIKKTNNELAGQIKNL